MNGSFLKCFSIALIFIGLTLTAEGKKPKQPERPNVLIFLADDLGWMDLGCQGSKFYETPNIDRLAREGVRFTNAYASHPRCVPSRYALITGKYPARAQMPGVVQSTSIPGDDSNLGKEEVSFADLLKEGGYSTFYIGKWHLASNGTFPEDVGFDKNIAGGKAGSPISYFYPYNEGKNSSQKAPIIGLEGGSTGEYLTDRITDETIRFLEERKKSNTRSPFLAFVSHYAVHEPLQAREELVKRFRSKLDSLTFDGPEYVSEGTGATKMRQDNPVYAAMIYSMDESLGRILSALRSTGEWDKTVVIFFSDNGGLSNRGTRSREVATSNYPLRAGKGHLYEGGIREPLIIRWPGVTRPGSMTDAVVAGTDLYPTIAEIAGLKKKVPAGIDGMSFADVLKGRKVPVTERTLFWHSPIARPQSTGDTNSSAIRKGDYKLIEWWDSNRIELYNLKNDLQERYDLSQKESKKAAELLSELRLWREKVNACMK